MKRLRHPLRQDQRRRSSCSAFGIVSAVFLFFATQASGLDIIYMAITPGKNFQHVIYPIAQEKGYMREEGIDLKMLVIAGTPSIQGLLAGSIQFTVAGTSALIAAAKGAAPLKVVLAANDKVHQWLLSKPDITSVKNLKGKRIATGGVAASATFMLKQILSRQGLDPNRDVNYIHQSGGTQLGALLSGSVDAIILGVQPRYIGVNAGMRELCFFGNEVKNSWGTLATSDRFIKEQPKQVAGFIRAAVKALRFVRQERDATIAANVKFSGVDRTLAVHMYDDLIGTFTRNGTVDEETQKNDLAIIRQIADVAEPIPIARAYDFSFAYEADRQLNQAGWHP
jgi:ABC-type nitrate/sulfonate/bicarbonate transport system substrate-binding protein